MGYARGAAMSALIAIVICSGVVSSRASAQGVGGAQAPSAPQAGGSEYGVLTRTASLSGVGTVSVTVAVNDLSTRKATIVVRMGWVHTGRTLTVSWPRGATLKAGTYHVSVSAQDHHSGNLRRTAHSSGVAILTVAAPVKAPAPPVAPAPAV